jgi:PAS domain S-box-containing protein
MHRLLERQLKKKLGRSEGFEQSMQWFIEAVNDAYAQSDEDRAMLERSMELSSRELLARNRELAVAEKKYRAIFENSTEGIFQIISNGSFISANPATAQILGYDDPGQLMASVASFADEVCVDAKRREEFLGLIRRDGTVVQFEFQARRRDRSTVWVSISVRPVRDVDGNIVHFEGTLGDIAKRKQAENERQELQSHMLALSRQAGMAEVATGVLHSVGNVLNSINVSASLASEKLRTSKLSRLGDIVAMLRQHSDDLGSFLSEDEKGRQLPAFLEKLSEHLLAEQADVLKELRSLVEHLEHVKQVVTMQQTYARTCGVSETMLVPDLVEDAIRFNAASFERHNVELVREFEPLPPVSGDKHRMLQILINLISNARYALREHQGERKLTIRIGITPHDSARFFIEVRDTGVGIPPQNLTRIFAHGFTTKSDGHGFGLHSSALAAKAMDGSIRAHSEGPGRGAAFTLELPLVQFATTVEKEREKAA